MNMYMCIYVYILVSVDFIILHNTQKVLRNTQLFKKYSEITQKLFKKYSEVT